MSDEYREGYADALADVPITSGDYAALEARIAEMEKALKIADWYFGYPERGGAVDETCRCSYCQYARVRGGL